MGWLTNRVQNIASGVMTRLRDLLRSDFVRGVSVLTGGTALSQALMVLTLPILTRLYSPSDFGVLAVYVSLLGIASVAACMRLEIAIPIPERDEDAANLLALALSSSIVVSALVGLVVWIFASEIVQLIERSALQPYLWLLPISIWFTSSNTAMQFWATRKKKFRLIAKTRLNQAIGGAGTQLGLGYIGLAPFGLLLGHMITSGAGLVTLGRDAIRKNRELLGAINLRNMLCMFKEYIRYPKYSTVEAFANIAGIQLPIIIIAALVAGQEAGYLMLATRVMAAPISLLGSSVGQVFLSRAPEELRADRLDSFTTNVIGGLAKIGVGPLVFMGVVASPVFAFVFGRDWGRAGDLVAWMTPWFVFQFLSSPVSMVMHIRNQQKAMLLLTIAGFVLRLGTILLAAMYSSEYLSELYAISSAVFYFFCYLVFSRVALIHPVEILNVLRRSAVPVLFWGGAGGMLRFIFESAWL